VDGRDKYISGQVGSIADVGYAQFLSYQTALVIATFSIPKNSFWIFPDDDQIQTLLVIVQPIEDADVSVIINETELPNYDTIVSPDRGNWDNGTTRGFPNESEYTAVKVDFYNKHSGLSCRA
jgi:amidase